MAPLTRMPESNRNVFALVWAIGPWASGAGPLPALSPPYVPWWAKAIAGTLVTVLSMWMFGRHVGKRGE